ncbi:MAG: hypothetical protein NC191_07430 [Muribaculaceae bacterium]|nr:hypothetical protein [Muribaculaceae bacterium]
MGQELELIVDMLKEIERANNTNSQSFDNLLNGINNKIDVMGRSNASAELLKVCLSELAKNIDDKYTTTISRFTEIEKALKAVFNAQDEHVKTVEIKELFDIFSTNLNNFYSESRQQRAILSGIETRLTDISTDKTDKEDILRTITLLRNDFENLNHSYKSAIDNVNSDLKAILSNMIKLDQTELAQQISEQVEIMYKATVEIVNYLTTIDKRESNLEKLLSNVATNESLKLTQGVIDSIIKKSEEISEKLTDLADKSDIKGLEDAASYMNDKLDKVVTKELFSKITTTTDALINQTDEIKQTLAGVTKNIDSQPDTRMFEDALQNLFKKFDSLSQDINKLDSGENLAEIDNRLNVITGELSVIKNIASDINDAVASKLLSAIEDISFENQSYDIKNHISKMVSELPQKEDIDRILENNLLNKSAVDTLIEKTDYIADRLDSLPTHQDMASLNNNQLSLVENLQEVANKSDIENLEAKTDEIEEMIDKLNFDNEFEQIYNKTSAIETWLTESDLKEKSDEILSQFPTKANQKDVLEILTTSNKIVEGLEELSKNTDAKKVNRTVAELYSMLEELKNDFINTTDIHNDSVIVALTELQQAAEKVVTVDEFDSFVEDLKSFVENNINNNENIEKTLATIKNQTSTVDSSISAIKELLLAKNAEFETFSNINNQTLASIENYISGIKETLSGSTVDGASKSSIENLETQLKELSEANNEYMQVLSSKLDNIIALSESEVTCNFESSVKELEEIKNQIQELGASFGNLNGDSSTSFVSDFLAEKLEELSRDISNLSSGIENKIGHGFAYNAELVEEKTGLLLDLIKELRSSNSSNIEMYERLTVADNDLIGFKQELELVNTDIINSMSSNTETLLNELHPLKEMISNLLSNIKLNSFDAATEPLNEVQETLRDNITDTVVLKKIDDIYIKISNEIAANETTIKDLLLNDIDSVLIKIDSLKDEIEESVSSVIPPSADEMIEFRNFAKEINEFKQTQEKLFSKLSQDISTAINEQFEIQNEKFESLLAVSNNTEAILKAIDRLKKCILSGGSTSDSTDEFGVNEYEKEFEQPSVEEIKESFENITHLISKLSDQNAEIKEVLNALQTRLVTDDSTIRTEDGIEIIDDIESNESSSIGRNSDENFDIIKALELLQKDVKTLHENITSSQPISKDWLEDVKNYIAGDDIRSMLEEINGKIDILSMTDSTEWVDEIRNVVQNISQNDSGQFSQYNNQVQSTLALINEKLDILSASDNSADFDDIRFSLDSIEEKLNSQDGANIKTLSESDAKITSMLELLNQKINILASYDDSETQFALDDVKALILEQKEAIDKLDNNSKTGAFKKCLDELSLEVNNINSNNSIEIQKTLKDMKESIMAAVVTIFEQVSFIEETEEIKDFVEEKTDEINKNLVEVTEQLKQITNTDTDYTYSMQDIESDLAKLRIALNEIQNSDQDANTEQLSFILDNINKIGSSVENLQSSIAQGEEFSDLKIRLNEIAATSDESYNTLGRILTDQLSTKVDRVTKLIERSNDSDKVMRQALIYIGEWIDSASISMNKISTNSDEIVDVKSALDSLKSTIPTHTDILNSIEEKFDEQQERLAYFEKQITKLGNLEDRFEQQQERIDRLEMALGKILTAVEDIDDSKVSRKIDKIDKQIAKLSTNIEKLTSYVD